VRRHPGFVDDVETTMCPTVFLGLGTLQRVRTSSIGYSVVVLILTRDCPAEEWRTTQATAAAATTMEHSTTSHFTGHRLYLSRARQPPTLLKITLCQHSFGFPRAGSAPCGLLRLLVLHAAGHASPVPCPCEGARLWS